MSVGIRTIAGLCVLAVAAPVRSAGPPAAAATPEQGRQAVERGLKFLVDDAATWRKERKCATCHHGTMTVWALSEAKARGYKVTPEVLADNVKWTKERFAGIDLPRDKRPGWSMVNTPALHLSMMVAAEPKQEVFSAPELKQIARHLIRHQEADGSWGWSAAPAQNRPPPVMESDEVATLLGYLALGVQAPAGTKEKSGARDAREKAAAWLAKAKPNDTTQAAALRLAVKAKDGAPRKGLRREIDGLMGRQNMDGGWPQVKGAASDAYATGQALYVLSLAGVKGDAAEVLRGVSFLVSTQRADGSWPMKSRAHPGAKPMKSPVPITHFGSAWGAMGLMRSVPREGAVLGARP